MNRSLFGSFAGRRVLVTGHTGFKGAWLTLWLNELGAQVVGYSQAPPTKPSHFCVANVETRMSQSIIGDVRDGKHFETVLNEVKPDLVMHLAAQSVVKTGYDEPIETFSTNVMGTAHVLEAIRQSKRACAVLIVTSDKCYENVEQIWGYRECDAMGDHEPYGGSKGAAELVVRAYRHSYFPLHRLNKHGVWLASARAGNVIGGGDWTANALIVDTVKALMTGKPIQIRSPHAVRPWQHVLQCLSGYLTIAANLLQKTDPQMCSGWNIGPNPGNELTVKQIVEYFIECWESGEWRDASDPTQPHEAGILRLSIDKALAHLHWKPTWDVHETLLKTAEWFKRFESNPDDMQKFSVAQIADFEQEMFALGESIQRKTTSMTS